MTARDIRYGRRGGRWIYDPTPPAPPVACDVCGQMTYSGAARHHDYYSTTTSRAAGVASRMKSARRDPGFFVWEPDSPPVDPSPPPRRRIATLPATSARLAPISPPEPRNGLPTGTGTTGTVRTEWAVWRYDRSTPAATGVTVPACWPAIRRVSTVAAPPPKPITNHRYGYTPTSTAPTVAASSPHAGRARDDRETGYGPC